MTYGTSTLGMTLIGDPVAKRQDPRTVVDGQFSGPFVLAATLATGGMTWDSYDLLHDRAVRQLLPLIVCQPDEEVEAELPGNMSGWLTVVAGGRTWMRMIRVPRGEPSNFLSEAELRAKFNGLAAPVMGGERANDLADAVLSLASAPSLGALRQ